MRLESRSARPREKFQSLELFFAKVPIVGTFLALAAVSILAGCSTPGAASPRQALRKAPDFYAARAARDLNLDDYLMLKLAARFRPELAGAVTESPRALFRDDPYLRLFDGRFAPEKFRLTRQPPGSDMPYAASAPFKDVIYAPRDGILLKALYAPVFGYDADDFALLLNSRRGDGGYDDTHGLLALLLLRAQKSFDAIELDRAIAEWSAGLAAAQENAKYFDDLYAERIVFLYWAGHGDLVKPEWIARVAAAQKPDGGFGPEQGMNSNAHVTGLSVLALIYSRDAKPAQPFFGLVSL